MNMKRQVIRRLIIPSFVIMFYLVLSEPVFAVKEIGGIVLKNGPQDLVKVTKTAGVWTSGAKKFPTIFVTLNSGRFVYQVRHDQKYKKGAIGLSEPTKANWYQAGMLNLFLNGERFNLLPKNHEKIYTESGKKGIVAFSWENDIAKVTYKFVLFAGDDKLFMEIKLKPKKRINNIEIRLQDYVSGFNHNPEDVLYTSTRKINKKGWQTLDPKQDNYIFYADNALDPADNPKAKGPSAVAFANSNIESLKVYLGAYGVPTILKYKPGSDRMVFVFWEFPNKPNKEALEYCKSSVPAALKTMNSPNTFSANVTSGMSKR